MQIQISASAPQHQAWLRASRALVWVLRFKIGPACKEMK